MEYFCFSGTIKKLKELEPRATINDNGFTISRRDVENSDSDVIDWLKELVLKNFYVIGGDFKWNMLF